MPEKSEGGAPPQERTKEEPEKMKQPLLVMFSQQGKDPWPWNFLGAVATLKWVGDEEGMAAKRDAVERPFAAPARAQGPFRAQAKSGQEKELAQRIAKLVADGYIRLIEE